MQGDRLSQPAWRNEHEASIWIGGDGAAADFEYAQSAQALPPDLPDRVIHARDLSGKLDLYGLPFGDDLRTAVQHFAGFAHTLFPFDSADSRHTVSELPPHADRRTMSQSVKRIGRSDRGKRQCILQLPENSAR